MRKAIIVLVVLAALGTVGWQVYARIGNAKKRGGRPQPTVAVEVADIQTGSIRDVGDFTGSLTARSLFVVAPKIAGRLEKLCVNIGDPVKNDQLIARLDSDEYEQQVDQARAELDVARATVAQTRSDLEIAVRERERSKALFEKKIASESEMDAAQAQYEVADAKHKVAQAQVEQKQAALKAAEVRLSYTQIRAGWADGAPVRYVGERYVDEGAMLKANDPIVSVLDLDVLLGVIYVIERDYPKVHVGQLAELTTDAYPGRSFTGRIVRIAPLLRETSRQARLEIEVANPDRELKPGMFIRVRIEFEAKPRVTLAPRIALARRNDREGVFLVDRERMVVRFVPVTTGIVDRTNVEIVSPALSGSVVTLGHHLLEDGSTITLAGTGPAATSAAGSGPGPRPGASRGGRP